MPEDDTASTEAQGQAGAQAGPDQPTEQAGSETEVQGTTEVRVLESSFCEFNNCVDVDFVEYNNTLYMLRYDRTRGWWVLTAVTGKPREIVVFRGPIEVFRVKDKALDKVAIIIKSPNAYAVGFDVESAIEDFRRKEPRARNKTYLEPFLRTLIDISPIRVGYYASGFYADGFVEGLKPYPAVSWDCEPSGFVEIARYITQTYPPSNRVYALANVAFAVTKVYSPALRLTGRRIFEDRVVLNIGEKWLGKSTLFISIVNLLGLSQPEVLFGGDNPVKTPERVRNLLMSTNAPMFLDDVGAKGFEAMNNIILPAVVSNVVTGTQASRYGYEIENKFVSLRSVVANTNLKPGAVARYLGQNDNTAWTRRFIIMNWANERIGPDVDPYSGRVVLGCLRELWQNDGFRGFVIDKAHSVKDLVEYVFDSLRRVYSDKVDSQVVRTYITAVRAVLSEVVTIENVVDARHTSEYMVIARIYEIARQVNPYAVVKALVENPVRFDVKVTGSKDPSQVERDKEALKALATSLGISEQDLEAEPGSTTFETLTDTAKALAYTMWLLKKGLNRVVIFAGSSDGAYPGWERKLFGSPLGKYMVDGRVRYGYSVPIIEIVKHLLNTADAVVLDEAKPTPQGSGVGGDGQA